MDPPCQTALEGLASKLKAGEEMNLSVNLSVQIDSDRLQNLEQEVKQALADLNLGDQVSISRDQQ